MVTSAADAVVRPRPAVSAVAPVAASTCLRVSPFPILVIRCLPEVLFVSLHVIPGRAEGANPESRCKYRLVGWIPGSRASPAPRNDRGDRAAPTPAAFRIP